MVVGRSPRNPVIGDTVLLRAENRQGIGTVVDTDAISVSALRIGYVIFPSQPRAPPRQSQDVCVLRGLRNDAQQPR
jgi:hypothetical protein